MSGLAGRNIADPAAVEARDGAFLEEVRAFLDTALTPDLREAGRRTLGVHADMGACRLWHRRLYERGWVAPAWPAEWGGTGWSARRRFLFERECALNDAPLLFATGLRSLGPLIIEQGFPAQRARYLQPMLSGEDMWCQGFSEPGAGSDLATISTRAERDGDHYVINGTKIWTTGAHLANRMFAVVRTASEGKPQNGLTFLLLDVDTPGISIAPIIDLAGEHEVNQVFFDGVRVPVENRIGAEGEGWGVAKRLMQLARSNNSPSALVRRILHRGAQALAASGDLDDGLHARLAGLQIELEAFAQLEQDALPSGRPRANDDANPSMLKLIGSELHQKVAAFALDVFGPMAMAPRHSRDEAMEDGAHAMAKYLAVRAATIYSGTSETHRNIIARWMM
ncbi:MAG: acyl-CoA dehydrogenase family protein [Hyphomonadaceae bacterium]|nr:MAG: acyl-CoA dehydrogenase domain-containing protein [Caulobacteraceae bacterium]MBT9446968.1 acyl-CoA dehydrogenase family protein [Hyphomonadaceae bacterium]TPW08143.1 MAG: acyl-CoA dehydrogenase domain-containing protein [Alphaproteobacteria bacterium]